MSEMSIAIPCHDRGENGPIWLEELFQTLKSQTYQDFDIVISDQSKNDLILDKCKEWSDIFDFTYIRYEGKVPCDNINTALENCDGRIVKMIFSDDIFTRDDALQKIYDAFAQENCKWLFTGYCETDDGKTFYNQKHPVWTKETVEGRNLLSSPSAVAFLNDSKVLFDPQVKLLLDVDFYHRMRVENGMPFFIEEVLFANRNHDNRVSSQATSQYDCVIQHDTGGWLMNKSEYEYIKQKYKSFFENDKKYPDEN